jgi:hypothetical protein
MSRRNTIPSVLRSFRELGGSGEGCGESPACPGTRTAEACEKNWSISLRSYFMKIVFYQ